MPEKRPDAQPEDLAGLQTRFASHIRDPQNAPAPGDVEDRRMDIYRNLFFKNIVKFLAGNFPVLRKLHDDESWQQLVRDFYIEHRARTPLFPEVPREFLSYLQEVRGHREGDLPFLLELAHWEWVELGLEIDERDLAAVRADPTGDLLADTPVISPLAWVMSYSYPVHEIRPGFVPIEPPPQPTHLIAYRDRDDRVKFMKVNEVTVLLLELLKEQPNATGQMALEGVAARLERADPQSVVAHGAALLENLRERSIVLGTRPNDNEA